MVNHCCIEATEERTERSTDIVNIYEYTLFGPEPDYTYRKMIRIAWFYSTILYVCTAWFTGDWDMLIAAPLLVPIIPIIFFPIIGFFVLVTMLIEEFFHYFRSCYRNKAFLSLLIPTLIMSGLLLPLSTSSL